MQSPILKLVLPFMDVCDCDTDSSRCYDSNALLQIPRIPAMISGRQWGHLEWPSHPSPKHCQYSVCHAWCEPSAVLPDACMYAAKCLSVRTSWVPIASMWNLLLSTAQGLLCTHLSTSVKLPVCWPRSRPELHLTMLLSAAQSQNKLAAQEAETASVTIPVSCPADAHGCKTSACTCCHNDSAVLQRLVPNRCVPSRMTCKLYRLMLLPHGHHVRSCSLMQNIQQSQSCHLPGRSLRA